jgi:hypothetical protein
MSDGWCSLRHEREAVGVQGCRRFGWVHGWSKASVALGPIERTWTTGAGLTDTQTHRRRQFVIRFHVDSLSAPPASNGGPYCSLQHLLFPLHCPARPARRLAARPSTPTPTPTPIACSLDPRPPTSTSLADARAVLPPLLSPGTPRGSRSASAFLAQPAW